MGKTYDKTQPGQHALVAFVITGDTESAKMAIEVFQRSGTVCSEDARLIDRYLGQTTSRLGACPVYVSDLVIQFWNGQCEIEMARPDAKLRWHLMYPVLQALRSLSQGRRVSEDLPIASIALDFSAWLSLLAAEALSFRLEKKVERSTSFDRAARKVGAGILRRANLIDSELSKMLKAKCYLTIAQIHEDIDGQLPTSRRFLVKTIRILDKLPECELTSIMRSECLALESSLSKSNGNPQNVVDACSKYLESASKIRQTHRCVGLTVENLKRRSGALQKMGRLREALDDITLARKFIDYYQNDWVRWELLSLRAGVMQEEGDVLSAIGRYTSAAEKYSEAIADMDEYVKSGRMVGTRYSLRRHMIDFHRALLLTDIESFVRAGDNLKLAILSSESYDGPDANKKRMLGKYRNPKNFIRFFSDRKNFAEEVMSDAEQLGHLEFQRPNPSETVEELQRYIVEVQGYLGGASDGLSEANVESWPRAGIPDITNTREMALYRLEKTASSIDEGEMKGDSQFDSLALKIGNIKGISHSDKAQSIALVLTKRASIRSRSSMAFADLLQKAAETLNSSLTEDDLYIAPKVFDVIYGILMTVGYDYKYLIKLIEEIEKLLWKLEKIRCRYSEREDRVSLDGKFNFIYIEFAHRISQCAESNPAVAQAGEGLCPHQNLAAWTSLFVDRAATRYISSVISQDSPSIQANVPEEFRQEFEKLSRELRDLRSKAHLFASEEAIPQSIRGVEEQQAIRLAGPMKKLGPSMLSAESSSSVDNSDPKHDQLSEVHAKYSRVVSKIQEFDAMFQPERLRLDALSYDGARLLRDELFIHIFELKKCVHLVVYGGGKCRMWKYDAGETEELFAELGTLSRPCSPGLAERDRGFS